MKKPPSRKKITPVILCTERQREKVQRLVDHCLKLDGTHIYVIEAEDQKEYPPHSWEISLAGLAGLHQVAKEFAGRPFFWLETDSIPRKPGWLAACTKEYYRAGKEFMFAKECEQKFLVGGIGIYGPNTSWLLPKTREEMARMNWDLWLCTNLAHAIHFSPLLQHRYCAEWDSNKNTVRENQFPRDQNILRDDAMIFHADKMQALIAPSLQPVAAPRPIFRHAGDLGDIVAALPAIRQMGGGNLVLCNSITDVPGLCSRESLKGERFEALRPLLEAQPYIESVKWSDENIISTDAAWSFRATLKFGESLAHAQARRLGVNSLDASEWLSVPNAPAHDRVVLARSERYHNPLWAKIWQEIGKTYGDRILFIGLEKEHQDMEAALGRKVEHAKTPDLLEAARLISGAPLVYTNQSCPAWITMGLHKKYVQETNMGRPNSRILYPGAFFAGNEEEANIVLSSLQKVQRQNAAIRPTKR